MAEKWLVQHEIDDEPTYVVPESDTDGEYISLSPEIPVTKRLKLAEIIREFMEKK